MSKYKIPCAHDLGLAPASEQVNDYHPLTRAELASLLHDARDADPRDAAGIQCRLGQAIPGSVCPNEIEGEVAEKHYALDKKFVETRDAKEGWDELEEVLWRIMQE